MTELETQNTTGHIENRGYQRLDLTEKTLNRTIFKLAAPAILEALLYSMIMLTDTLIAGRLREEKFLAAVALGSLIIYFANACIHGLGAVTVSIVARAWGEENFADARKYAGHAIFLTFAIATGIMMVGYPFAGSLLKLFGAGPEVISPGTRYMRIIVFSMLLGQPLIISNGIIRAKGDMFTAMCITGTMNVTNAVVSVVLAFGIGPFPAMGFVGIAIGTLLARSFGGLVSMGILMSANGINLRLADILCLQRKAFARIFYLGWPTISERLANTIMYIFFMRIVAMLGTVSLAAHELALTVESLAFMPAFGFGLAVTTVVGQAIGAQRPHIAELAVKRTISYSAVMMVLIGVVFVLLAEPIVGLFGSTGPVRQLAVVALRISAIELPFLGITMIFAGSLRGAGDTRSPLIVSTLSAFVIRIGLVYLFAIVFGWGLSGAWVAAAIDWCCRAVGLWVLFNRGVWKKLHNQEKMRFE